MSDEHSKEWQAPKEREENGCDDHAVPLGPTSRVRLPLSPEGQGDPSQQRRVDVDHSAPESLRSTGDQLSSKPFNNPYNAQELQKLSKAGVQETNQASVDHSISEVAVHTFRFGLYCFVITPEGEMRRVFRNSDDTLKRDADGNLVMADMPYCMSGRHPVLTDPAPPTKGRFVFKEE